MVYITQEDPRKNLLPAAKYGELKVVLPQGNICFSTGEVVHRCRKELSRFNDKDYLLLIGDPIAIAIATVVASETNQGKVKFLKWDRQEQIYYPVEINLYQKGER